MSTAEGGKCGPDYHVIYHQVIYKATYIAYIISNQINKKIFVTLNKQSFVSIILKTTYLFSLASINRSFSL